MKMKWIHWSLALILGGFLMLSSCAESSTKKEAETENVGDGEKKSVGTVKPKFHHDHGAKKAALGREYASAYVCPMHCKGSGSAEAGTCPTCGMDYEARAEHENDGHLHETEGAGHDHDHGDQDHDQDDHGHSHGDHDHG